MDDESEHDTEVIELDDAHDDDDEDGDVPDDDFSHSDGIVDIDTESHMHLYGEGDVVDEDDSNDSVSDGNEGEGLAIKPLQPARATVIEFKPWNADCGSAEQLSRQTTS